MDVTAVLITSIICGTILLIVITCMVPDIIKAITNKIKEEKENE